MDIVKEIANLPAVPGEYALYLYLPSAQSIIIRHYGAVPFPAGDYLYCGSAKGPGGLRSRLGRHLLGPKALRWHIDYLRYITELAGYCIVVEPAKEFSWECRWSHHLAGLPGIYIPKSGFGATDCTSGCLAHCFWLPDGRAGLASLPEYSKMVLA